MGVFGREFSIDDDFSAAFVVTISRSGQNEMVENFPIRHPKFHRPRLAVLPNDRHARPTPKPFVHRVGGALARFFERDGFGSGRQRFQKFFSGLEHAQPFSLFHPFWQFIRFRHIFQEIMKIRVGDALDFHPAQAPQFGQQFFGQETVRQEDGVVMHPAAFVEFDLDAIGRINDVIFALMLDTVPELKEKFAQPVAAVFKRGFFVGVVFRVEREREK